MANIAKNTDYNAWVLFFFVFFYIKMQVLRDVLKTSKYNYTYTDLSYSLKYTSTNTQTKLWKVFFIESNTHSWVELSCLAPWSVAYI